MSIFRIKIFLPVSAVLLLCACGNPCVSETEQWIQLFNGRDLSGWTVKIKGYPAGENFANTFRVEDGILKVCYDGYGRADRE